MSSNRKSRRLAPAGARGKHKTASVRSRALDHLRISGISAAADPRGITEEQKDRDFEAIRRELSEILAGRCAETYQTCLVGQLAAVAEASGLPERDIRAFADRVASEIVRLAGQMRSNRVRMFQ